MVLKAKPIAEVVATIIMILTNFTIFLILSISNGDGNSLVKEIELSR